MTHEQIGYNSSDILQLERKVQVLEQWLKELSEAVNRHHNILSISTTPYPTKTPTPPNFENDEFAQSLLCRTTLYTNFVSKQTANVQFLPKQVEKWSTHQFMVEVLLALQKQIS